MKIFARKNACKSWLLFIANVQSYQVAADRSLMREKKMGVYDPEEEYKNFNWILGVWIKSTENIPMKMLAVKMPVNLVAIHNKCTILSNSSLLIVECKNKWVYNRTEQKTQISFGFWV